MGATAIVDAFWGDAGKGVVSAWMAYTIKALGVFRPCGGPGAEHGAYISGKYFKVNQLPLGPILTKCIYGIGPGVVVDPVKFLAEVKRLKVLPKEARIDFKCPIVTQENIDEEMKSSGMNAIGSTKSGTGAAMSDAVLRKAPLARDILELKPYLEDIPLLINNLATLGDVILESSQGTMLSRYFGDYPYVTSVDVTTGSLIAGTGLNWNLLEDVVLVVKAMPTREGTGPMGEVEEFTVKEMEDLDIVEYSSINDPKTGKPQIRRKTKGIDWDLLKRVAIINGPTQIALTFVEHFDPEMKNVTHRSEVTEKVKGLIRKVEKVTGAPVTMINTGKDIGCMIGVDRDLPKITNKVMQRLQSYI